MFRGQRSEVRGQRSEVRGQRLEVRGQRSEVIAASLVLACGGYAYQLMPVSRVQTIGLSSVVISFEWELGMSVGIFLIRIYV